MARARRGMRRCACLIGAALLAASGGTASAGPELHPVSSAPYTLGPVCQSDGLDGEVSLAVDRASGRMVAAWMQQVAGLGNPALATDVVVTSSSRDGVHWSRAGAPPGVMVCEAPPGPADAEVDPSVSVGPDQRWYLGRLGADELPGPSLTHGLFVSRSADGVRWEPLARPVPDRLSDDFDTVVADPSRPGRAYATRTDYNTPDPLPPTSSRIAISPTTNGGATFGAPTTVHQSRRGFLDVVARLVAFPDGSLLDVYTEIPTDTFSTPGPFTLYATRSRDHARSWSRPVTIATGNFADLVDPHTHAVYAPYCCVSSLAAGPNDSAHLTWVTETGPTSADVHLASSADGGRSWSELATLQRPAQAFQSTVAAGHGTIALTFYDFSGEQPADQGRPTTLWLARSADDGASWAIEPLAGPFDLRSAGTVGVGALGDYQALVPTSDGFEAAFTLARPYAQHGPTDVFAAAIPPFGG